jgi:hypothetical protein
LPLAGRSISLHADRYFTQIFGAAMLTINLPAAFGAAMLTASLCVESFGAARLIASLLLAVGLLNLVEETWVALTLVRLAFLVALRLLMIDFFSIDIVRSFILIASNAQLYCTAVAKPWRR